MKYTTRVSNLDVKVMLILLEGKTKTIASIAEELETSESTIERSIKRLREDYCISGTRGNRVGAGVRLEEQFTIRYPK